MRLLEDGDFLAKTRGTWLLVAERLERDFLHAHCGGVVDCKAVDARGVRLCSGDGQQFEFVERLCLRRGFSPEN